MIFYIIVVADAAMKSSYGSAISQSEEYKSFRGSIPLKNITVAPNETWTVYDTGSRSSGTSPLLCLPPISGTADIFFKQCLGKFIEMIALNQSQLIFIFSLVCSRIQGDLSQLACLLDSWDLVSRTLKTTGSSWSGESSHLGCSSGRVSWSEVCGDDERLSQSGKSYFMQHIHR